MFKQILMISISAIALTGCSPKPATDSAETEADVAPVESAATIPELIPREVIFGNPTQIQGRISPDGKYVSWLAPKEGVMNVWIAPSDDAGNAKAITDDKARGINSHTWAPNSEFVYYVQDNNGDENFRIYASDVNTGEVTLLTDTPDGVRASIQGVAVERPDELLYAKNDRNPQLFDLHMVNVRTGVSTPVKENPGYGAWLIDNTLTPRFGLETTPGGGANIVDFEGNVLFSIPAEDLIPTYSLGFNKDNTLIYAVDSRGRDKAALVTISAEDGSATVLAESDKADINNVLIHPQTNEILAYSVEYKRVEWSALNDEIAADIALLNTELTGDLSILSATTDLSKAVIYADAAEAPGVYYVFDRETKSLNEMFNTRPDLAGYELQPMQALEIPSRDGLTLVSYLTLPPGSDTDGNGIPESPMPMVLAVHGGPWARDAYGYNSWHQWMANRGYAVLSVNYRGSTGFGKAFVNAAVKELAGRMHDDLIDGVEWAVANGIADPDKVAIAGGSYGGYATLVGVTFTPDTFACGVDIVGFSSLITLIESFPEYWKPFLEGTWYKYAGDPSIPEYREDLLARSPITRVDDIRVPLLIGHGENDPRVTKLESDQLVDVMAEKGLPVTYVNFPDEGHGFVRPENRLAFYSVMEGFLGECLGGRSEDINTAFEGSSIQVLYGAEYVAGVTEALAETAEE